MENFTENVSVYFCCVTKPKTQRHTTVSCRILVVSSGLAHSFAEASAWKTSQSNHTRTTALSNSMKLSHARGATQDGRVMVERSDRMWSSGEGNGKPLQYSCLENPMNSMKRQNDRILKKELPR